jgi:macrocin-O-methyltransferase TylF-like protien
VTPTPTSAPGGRQTEAERQVPGRIAEVFENSPDDLPTRLASMARYARRAQVTRFAALYELFKLVLPVKGSIVECGVYRGASFMTFAQLSAALEPTNLTRRLYGFDSFGGFPSVSAADRPGSTGATAGDLAADSYDELNRLLELYEPTRVAIKNLVPRMPKGAVLAFDELDNPLWPGETSAALDELGLNRLELRRFEFDPYIGYAVI